MRKFKQETLAMVNFDSNDHPIMLIIDSLAHDSAGLDERAFWRTHPTPALVLLTPAPPRGLPPREEMIDPDSATEAGNEVHGEYEVGSRSEVLFLPSQPRCSVGRGEENELVLRNRTVSKTHATMEYDSTIRFFRLEDVMLHSKQIAPATGWRIRPFATTNGTFVDGEEIPSGRTANLDDGSEVRFGAEIRAKFLSPGGLFGLLELYRMGIAS